MELIRTGSPLITILLPGGNKVKKSCTRRREFGFLQQQPALALCNYVQTTKAFQALKRKGEIERERTAAKTHAGSGLPFARTSIAAARRSVREPARPLRLRAPPCPPPTHLRPSRRLRGRPRRGRCRPPPRRRHRPCPFPPPPRLRPRRRHLRRHHPHRQTWT